MIGSLKGNVTHIFANSVILDVSGVGYEVALPSRIMARICKNDALFLFIHTAVREDDISLFGFKDASDKEMFLALNKVNGVGAKTALNILGLMSAAEISDAISFEDKARFTQVSGIGPKAAVRIINDLKDKVAKMSVASSDIELTGKIANVEISVANNSNQLLKDALSALENLGYQKNQILDIVKNVVLEEDDLSNVITKTLKQLSR